jgi:hypothetical protein
MFVLEQALVVIALVGACGLAYRLLSAPGSSGSCHSGGDCGCEPEGPSRKLTRISRRPKA